MDVVIATFGSLDWAALARNHAGASVSAVGGRPIYSHGRTLAEARNAGLDDVTTEHVVFLDADDELEHGYIEAMKGGTADLRAPQVRYVTPTTAQAPYFPRVAGHQHDCTGECLPDGNWLVIGTAVRTDLARAVRFREEPIYEDWSFFLRCWTRGCTVERIPGAVYRAHARPDSRNRAPSMAFKNEWHHKIVAAA